jgi:RND superfamily putative drug exporter
MGALSRFVLRHKLIVAIAWLGVFAAGMALISRVPDRLSQEFSLPDQPGYEANQAIVEAYGNGGRQLPLVAVVTLPSDITVDSPGIRRRLGAAFDAIAHDPHLRVVSYISTRDPRFVSADGRTTFGLVFFPERAGFGGGPTLPSEIETTLGRALPQDTSVSITGIEPLTANGDRSGGPGVLGETLLGAAGALLVLMFVFASLLAAVPLAVAAVSILTTFLLVLALTTVTEVSFFVQYLVALIGLGAAIDYSLLIVTRWREERAHGRANLAAVQAAMETAGRAVAFSGVAVAVGLFALVFLPVPFLRSIGYGGMLIPLVSVAVSLTLLPVLLATAGPRLDWPRLRKEVSASRGWTAWARWVVRRRWIVAIAALAFLLVLASAAMTIRVGDPRADSLARSGPAYDGLRQLEQAGIPTGVLTPMEVIVRAGADPRQVAAELAAAPGVHSAVAPSGPGWRRDGIALVDVLPVDETSSAAGRDTIHRLRSIAAGSGSEAVGGKGPEQLDFIHAVYGAFPLVLTFVVLLTFLLLTRAFRSLLLSAKAVLLNLVSVAATYGVLVVVWQNGHGSKAIWGIPATGAITDFVPLMVFAFLFGLSMDYEMFILARVREEYDAASSTPRAIIEGIGRTGRLVTSAALILFFAFVSLASGPETVVKIFATGLGVGILLDATVVRALLVPALVSLFGRWNWWLPTWAARALRVAPSQPALETADQSAPRHRNPTSLA